MKSVILQQKILLKSVVFELEKLLKSVNCYAVLGDDYADDGETVTVPQREGTINVAWNIYEFAALQIPLRHVHEEGECKAPYPDTSPEEEGSDPRWDELKKIKTL